MMGLLWLTKLYNAKPVPKAVPLVGSLMGAAWLVEYQGKAGYAWQVIPDVGDPKIGISSGFYQAVIDSYYWQRNNTVEEEGDVDDPAPVAVAVGPYVLTAQWETFAKDPSEAKPHAKTELFSAGVANIVWPGGAMKISYDEEHSSPIEGLKEIIKIEPNKPGFDVHELSFLETKVLDIGELRFTLPDDEVLGVTLVGLQILAGKSMGKMLEGKA